jgi:hypothetical protein
MHPRHPGLPLYQQILVLIFMPPIMTGLWSLMSRGLTDQLGTTDSPSVQGFTESLGWFLLGALYLIGLVLFVCAHFN